MPACQECGRELPPGSPQLCPDCARRYAQHSLLTDVSLLPGTATIIAANLAVFLGMVLRGVPFINPNAPQVLAWGANYGPLTLGSQWWRLFTAMFVHIGIVHLLLNMWCLWELGRLAERIYGRLTYLLLYLVCGVSGSLLSAGLRPMGISAGASGAIFGVAGALITTLHYGHLPIPRAAVSHTLRSLVAFAGYNLVFGFVSAHIDNSAHIGGLVAGLLLGAWLARDIRHRHAVPATGPSPEPSSAATLFLFLLAAGLLTAGWFGARRLQWPTLALQEARDSFRGGKPDQAIRQLQLIMDRKPQMSDAYFALAGIYEQQKRPDDAEKVYQRLLQAQPKLREGWEQLGSLYLETGRREQALSAFNRVIELEPRDPKAHFNLALIQQQGGECAAALPHYQKALELDPRFAVAAFNIGHCQMDLKNYDAAIVAFQQAAKLSPQSADAYQWLANAYSAKGMTAESEMALAKAQQLRRAKRR